MVPRVDHLDMLIPQWLVSQVDHLVTIQIGDPKSDGSMRRLLVTAYKWFRKRWSHEWTTLTCWSRNGWSLKWTTLSKSKLTIQKAMRRLLVTADKWFRGARIDDCGASVGGLLKESARHRLRESAESINCSAPDWPAHGNRMRYNEMEHDTIDCQSEYVFALNAVFPWAVCGLNSSSALLYYDSDYYYPYYHHYYYY